MKDKVCNHCGKPCSEYSITVDGGSQFTFYFCSFNCFMEFSKIDGGEPNHKVNNYSEKCKTCYARFDEFECSLPCFNCEFEELEASEEPCKDCKEENCKFQDRRN